jgi:hypothetical protein
MTQLRPHIHFVRHLVEMTVAMMAGMMIGGGLLAAALGTSVPDVRRAHAVVWVLVMALDMTVPMVAVMLYRGHSWRSAAEMAAAMIVPALPIVALQLVHAAGESAGGMYMLISTVAMVGLIVYRRAEYRGAAAHA